jgi:hypothetical protein
MPKFVKRGPAGQWSDRLFDRAMRAQIPPPAPADPILGNPVDAPGAPALPADMSADMLNPMEMGREAAPLAPAAVEGAALSPWLLGAGALGGVLYPTEMGNGNLPPELVGANTTPASVEVTPDVVKRWAKKQTDATVALPAGSEVAKQAEAEKLPAALQGSLNRAKVGAAADEERAGRGGPELDFIRAAVNAKRGLNRQTSKNAKGVATPIGADPGYSDSDAMTMEELVNRREAIRQEEARKMRGR